ncbi:PGAP2-interacting protein-like isoform X2 [Scyliorhinus canicula]|uniref:PGAP2-interacting protein-like isoform X2 n=1 Tax=Scyliorhinus canicula TaxID=7830 RepID=UPI0018F72A3A|nr:PGAP2-interacting protein-like isoform X2 [Scyliorhinus canicula]
MQGDFGLLLCSRQWQQQYCSIPGRWRPPRPAPRERIPTGVTPRPGLRCLYYQSDKQQSSPPTPHSIRKVHPLFSHCVLQFGKMPALHRDLLLEVSLGYISCSLHQSLAPMLWYFSLQILGLTGYEIFAAAYISPLILNITPIWNLVNNKYVLALLRLISLDFQKVPQEKEEMKRTEEKNESDAQRSWIVSGAAFGSLQFLTHWIFGEVSLVSRWAVSGHPNTGPDPNPYGGVILIALALGVMLSFWPSIVNSVAFWLIGVASAIGIFYLRREGAFTAGTVLAIYTMSLWPHLISRLISSGDPGKALSMAMLVYVLEMLGTVWCTAYNFVPGGAITREQTIVVLGVVMHLIGLGLFYGRQSKSFSSETNNVTLFKHLAKYVKLLLWLLVGLGLLGLVHRFKLYQEKLLNQPAKKDISAMIWSYRFGYDNQGWPSLERSAELIEQTGADLITILESDASKPYLGNNDLTMWLGEKLGFYMDFGPSTKDHTWGTMILSRYPIVRSMHHLLPSPQGELAPAISMTVNISGNLMDFVVAHFGNEEDDLDRKLQAQYISNLLKEIPQPLVFLGYITSAPGSRDYIQIRKIGNVKDIDHTDPDRWCEYIMYRGLIRLGYARISHGGLSDTEVQLAKFRIPDDQNHYEDNDEIETDPTNVPEEIHFNPRFGSFMTGHNSEHIHHFHMNTPKYFLQHNKKEKLLI